MHWRGRITIFSLIVLLTVAVSQPAVCGPPTAGDNLPEFYLPVPAEDRSRQYLGLDEKSKFKIADIKADVVIIQIFSMY